ncbi:hypothetical protein AHAS_Ahas02G0128300 [Arachis hypogaea]
MSSGKAKMWEEDHDPSSGGGGMDELLAALGYKAKMWEEDHDPSSGGGGMDELLVALGYKVHNSDMAGVA